MLTTARIALLALALNQLSIQAIAISNQDPADSNPYALEKTSLIATSMGLELLLPKDAKVTSDQRPGKINYLITDGVGEIPTWSIRIQPLNSTQPNPTAAGLVEQYLRSVTGAKTLINEPVNYANRNGHQLFVENQAADGRSATVQGWVILPTSQRTFIVFAVVTTPDRFSVLFGQLKASFDTIRLLDDKQKNAQRLAKLSRGRAVINTFTPTRLKTLVGREACYRIYTPSQSGKRLDDQEMGFMIIRSSQSMKGELSPERKPDTYTQMESEQGLMVTIELKILGDNPRQHLDVYSQYWLAWDRSSEAWSTRSTYRQGQKTLRTTGETGTRQRANLTVITSGVDSMAGNRKEWTLPDSAYLSQPEVFFLGALLPRDNSLKEEMSFYSFDTGKQSMPLRTDKWEQAKDRSGNWVLTTKPAKQLTSVRQIFDSKGKLLRRISDDGMTFELIDPTELHKLWLAKGLSR